MKKQELIIEKATEGFFGRTMVEDNLIVVEAETVDELEKSMKKVIKDFDQIESITFEIKFDLSALFENFKYLKITTVAEKAGVNPGLLRQYVSGVKFPSAQQAKRIEDAIHIIAEELKQVKIYTS